MTQLTTMAETWTYVGWPQLVVRFRPNFILRSCHGSVFSGNIFRVNYARLAILLRCN